MRSHNTAFTYQGRLAYGMNVANSSYDLKFSLHDAASGGGQIGSAVTNSAVGMTNGLFNVALDFGADACLGERRCLEMDVRTNGSAVEFTTLAPRQALLPRPYAVYAANADVAVNASNAVPGSIGTAALALGAVDASRIAESTITAGKIGSGQVVRSVNGLKDDVTVAAGANVTLSTNGNTLSIAASGGGSSGWNLTGNAGTTHGVNFLGTTDSR